MASSLLQLSLRKCSTFNKRSVLSVINNKLFDETTVAHGTHGTGTNSLTNLCQTRSLCCPKTSQTKQTNVFQKCYYDDVRQGLLSTIHRKYSTNEENRRPEKLPTLMEFPIIVYPSPLKRIKNWILVNFIVRPYFDQDFTMARFVDSAKQAIHVVSSYLASGDFQSLDGLVTVEALDVLKKNVSAMSMSQRNQIAVNKDDIFYKFPYQVGIIFDESNEKVQKRFVEITMVFHVLRGLKEMLDNGTTPPLNYGMLPEYQGKVSICTYRFVKQFTKGYESDWTINMVNHFKPIDFINE